MEFDQSGNYLKSWGGYSSAIDGFGSPVGVAVDHEDRLFVSDSENNMVLRSSLSDQNP